MNNSGNFADKWNTVFHKIQDEVIPEEQPTEPETGLQKAGNIISIIGRVIYRLRKVFMTIPVVFYALRLAAYNMEHLPEQVGINLLSNGEFAEMISRATAVNMPLIVTAACIVLMFFSRKALYPWVISIFSLVLPILILITNNYPA